MKIDSVLAVLTPRRKIALGLFALGLVGVFLTHPGLPSGAPSGRRVEEESTMTVGVLSRDVLVRYGSSSSHDISSTTTTIRKATLSKE